MILPEEKLNEASYTAANQPNQEHDDSDLDSDTLEFPEVPQALVLRNVNIATAPEMTTPLGLPHHKFENLSSSHSGVTEDVKQEQVEEQSIICKDEPQTSGRKDDNNKQFVPFISPPLVSPESFSTRHGDVAPSHEKKFEADDVDFPQSMRFAATKQFGCAGWPCEARATTLLITS